MSTPLVPPSSLPASRATSPAPMASPQLSSSRSTENFAAGSSSSAAAAKSAKRSNPLIDLIESEKEYVDLLAGIIRKVASAWSRTNFPPAELDSMFRAIEVVYRSNRAFLTKLKEVGPNPSSPKALGDLLMRWIEDLDSPYARYCGSYMTGFDHWDPVQSNPGLAPLLQTLSEAHPPPAPASTWTLDSLFDLPRLRVKYYKKLYSRLLKSTQPGRSDHKLLVTATDRLDALLLQVTERFSLDVGGAGGATALSTQDADPTLPPRDLPPVPHSKSEAEDVDGPLPPIPRSGKRPSVEGEGRASVTSSIDSDPRNADSRVMSSVSGSSRSDRFSRDNTDNERSSQTTEFTSVSAGRSSSTSANGGLPVLGKPNGIGPSPLSSPSSPPPEGRSLAHLEENLDTSQVLDIFTMKPKPCKLQIANPVNPLPFSRIIRFEADVVVSFVPRATGQEVVYNKAHVVMLTDLFLVCEWANDTDDRLLLCFPPLAARHLKIVDEPVGLGAGSETTFQVQVMRKETLVIRTMSPVEKERLAAEFFSAVEGAQNLAPPARANGSLPPPPSGPTSPAGSLPPQIPPIVVPGHGHDPIPPGPRTSGGSTSQSFRDFPNTQEPGMLSLRNSEPGMTNQLSGLSIGGSDTNLPLSNESGGYFPPPRNASFNNGPPPPSGPYPPNSNPMFSPGSAMPPPGQRFGPGPGPGGHMGPPPGAGYPVGPSGAPLRKSPSGRSLGSNSVRSYEQDQHLPPLPSMPPQQFQQGGYPPMGPGRPFPPNGHPMMGGPHGLGGHGFYPPPHQLPPRSHSQPPPMGPDEDESPPASPVEEKPTTITGPTAVTAQMKCKVFLKQQHAQWKSLGAAKLKLFEQQQGPPVKQLVVEADTKHKDLLISTIVLTDAVERVGRTGVAVEISDKGVATGIVYMIQLRNETSASGLFDSLLAGSDRTTGGRHPLQATK